MKNCNCCITYNAPDLMGGGVTAALVEEEAEDRPSNPLADYWLREYNRRDQDAKRWKETARREVRKVHDEDGLVMRAVRAARTLATENGFLRDDLAKAEQERDSWESIAQQTARSIDALRAEHPRPLTPDDMSSEELRKRTARVQADVLRAHREGRDDWARIAVFAALTEPPTRPEGAAEIEAAIREVVPSNPGDRYGDLANRLAERGVRVTGAES